MNLSEIDAIGYGLEASPHRRVKRKLRLFESAADKVAENSGDAARINQLDVSQIESRRLYERASAYVGRSQYNLGVSLLRRVVRDIPDDPNGWYLLGFALGELGRRRESIECFDRVIELEPSRAMAFANRGWQRLRIRDLTGAIVDLRQASDLDPSVATVWNHLGLALARAKKLEGAAEAYRHAAFIDGEDVRVCLALSSALRRLGRREEASIWRRKVVSLMIRSREPKPTTPSTSEFERYAVGKVLIRESLVVDIKAVRRQKQVQKAVETAQNPVAWMMFLILVALLYVLLGN